MATVVPLTPVTWTICPRQASGARPSIAPGAASLTAETETKLELLFSAMAR